MRYYCPECWHDFPQDLSRCPDCGLEIHSYVGEKDYVQKLIVALGHREPETPIRAAWILGKLGDERAVEPLISLVSRTQDVYIALAAAEALAKLRTPRSRRFLESLARSHPASMVREAATAALSDNSERPVERTA